MYKYILCVLLIVVLLGVMSRNNKDRHSSGGIGLSNTTYTCGDEVIKLGDSKYLLFAHCGMPNDTSSVGWGIGVSLGEVGYGYVKTYVTYVYPDKTRITVNDKDVITRMEGSGI